jgi:hypothetical protein
MWDEIIEVVTKKDSEFWDLEPWRLIEAHGRVEKETSSIFMVAKFLPDYYFKWKFADVLNTRTASINKYNQLPAEQKASNAKDRTLIQIGVDRKRAHGWNVNGFQWLLVFQEVNLKIGMNGN